MEHEVENIRRRLKAKEIPSTIPEVYILESLNFDDEKHHKEGEVLSRTLRMAEKSPKYVYVRSKLEFIHFLSEFDTSRYRYLHISCHGNKKKIGFTIDDMSVEELAQALVPVLSGRRLFLSSCQVATRNLAELILLKQTKCFSIVGPHGEIPFDDSAILWSAFYHMMFKHRYSQMSKKVILEKLETSSKIVGHEMQLFTRDGGKKEIIQDLVL